MGRQPPIVIPLAPVLGEGPLLEWVMLELERGSTDDPQFALALHRSIDEAVRLQDPAGAAGDPPPDKESP